MALASESEELSHSIERLYDAVLDPSKWCEALEATTRFVGGEAANLFWQDAATNHAAVFHSWNENAYYSQLYAEKYASLNPYFPALAFVEVGKLVAGGDLIPHDEFRQTRFYLEWVKPQNYIDVLGANLERTLTSTAFFSVQRHERQGIVDDRARERCTLILPHVRRAVSIGKVIETGRTHDRLLENALIRISSAALMVDASGRIVFANAKADEYLAHAAIIRPDRGILHAIDRDADRALKDALRPSHVWSIRTKLQIEGKKRDLALFNLAIDSKLRGCDVVAVRSMTSLQAVTRWIEQPSTRRRRSGRFASS